MNLHQTISCNTKVEAWRPFTPTTHSPWGCKESDTTKRLILSLFHKVDVSLKNVYSLVLDTQYSSVNIYFIVIIRSAIS